VNDITHSRTPATLDLNWFVCMQSLYQEYKMVKLCVHQHVLPIKLRFYNERSILKLIRQNNIGAYSFSVTHALLKAETYLLKKKVYDTTGT
jgi:hypothetical protein